MKHQQVSVDVASMVFSACSYLALAGAVWIFLRLVQACFWLPRRLRNENNIQRMLEDKVSSYERYVAECEDKERAMELEGSLDATEENGEKPKSIEETRKWKDRRECLDMLKKELQRIRDGGDPYDWDHLLDEEEKKLLFGDTDDEEEKTAKDELAKEKDDKDEFAKEIDSKDKLANGKDNKDELANGKDNKDEDKNEKEKIGKDVIGKEGNKLQNTQVIDTESTEMKKNK